MKIIVCGAQVPFMRGGAEMLMENLCAALEAEGHCAELVRLPVGWDRERLFDAPVAWRLIPLNADLVIAINFPSYFARHPRKIVWLFHQHRAAYELADAPWSDLKYDDLSLETQRQLAQWDSAALLEAERIFTASKVVSDRLSRFNGIESTPLHHPPPLADRLHGGPFRDYVVLPSRLMANKRPHLAIEAMAHTSSGVKAIVVGEGPLEPDLQALARRLGVQSRVELTGFVSDERLVELYSEALAVLYPPLEEDYGYVTLQAFLAGKPVITCRDSGGVLEWVEDGLNGIVTDGSAAAIGGAIERLAGNRELAQSMGTMGRERAAALTWKPVVETLVGAIR
jgi:glycosyltransferase involved in cell wall biosynthesis